MELIAEKREKLGKKTKSLKIEGKIPAVIFGKNMESTSVSLDAMSFKKVFKQAGETDLIDVKIDGAHSHKVLVKNVQYDPVYGGIIHAELYAPDLTIKTEAPIPVEVVGEDQNELIKGGEAMLFYVVDEILVKALPADLPHAFVIDVSKMITLGEGVKVSELNFDKSKVEIVNLEPEELVVRLDKVEIREDEPEETAVSEEEAIEAMEALKEKKPEEGEEETQEKK